MKLLILITFMLPLMTFAQSDDCKFEVAEPILGNDVQKIFETMGAGIKRDFKRRPLGLPLRLALSIETNFDAPLIGKDTYWGRIYIKDSDPNNIFYRDDLLAEDNYKNEQAHPNIVSNSVYPVNKINSAAGLSLVKAAGAEVNVKAVGKFSTTTGGRLTVKVKPPGDKAIFVTIDVVNNKGKISNFLVVNNKRVPFDSFKINASTNFLGITSILNGVDNIQFSSGGKLIHTIKP